MWNLLIRADASAEIGVGHAMRCLALAEAWRLAGGNVEFVSAFRMPALERRLETRGMRLCHLQVEAGSPDDAQQLVALARQRSAAAVVVDGYAFGYQYHHAIKRAGLKLLCIDDYGHAGRYCADIVLNQNLWAAESLYARREQDTDLLLGARYALLRREFLETGRQGRMAPETARKLLITLGGGDSNNVTMRIVEALRHMDQNGFEAVVIAGPANPHVRCLRATILESGLPIRLEEETESMPRWMNWADLAISAAGSTCWEMAFMGLPAAVVVAAENQRPCAATLHEMGVVTNLGNFDELAPERVADALTALMRSSEQRARMASRGMKLIDGHGAGRVVSHLSERGAPFGIAGEVSGSGA